jgi:hypothetical protein
MKTIEVISLIYKSPAYADFIVDQLTRYAVDFDDWKVSFRLVANNPSAALENHLHNIRVHHSVIRQDPNKHYMNRVYRAWNEAVWTSRAEYVCLVNSDMAFSPDWLKNLALWTKRPDMLLTSRLVESGKMPSGYHGVSKYFGNTPQSYNEQDFLSFAKEISCGVCFTGGLYMPLLISRDLFIQSGGYPLGNIYADGVGTCNGPVVESGDANFFKTLKKNFGVNHTTVFDSVVYHFQEGELDEPL